MILEYGNMWNIFDETDYFCITTNSSLLTNGELVMGAGIAKQAKDRFPELPHDFGKIIKNKCGSYGIYEFIIYAGKIGAFQTKTYWKNPSTLELIFRSTYHLLNFSELMNNKRFDLNFPGVGYGGLDRRDVLPIISVLPDNVRIWSYGVTSDKN